MADSIVTFATQPIRSRTIPACSLVESTPLWEDATWATMKPNIAACVGAIKTHIYPFGVVEPWASDTNGPTEASPSGWTDGGWTVHHSMVKAREISATAPIILTLYSGNWFDMSILGQSDGVSTAKTFANRYNSSGRMTQDGLVNWGILIDAILDRYAITPYLVRDFEVWNELKGYYSVPAGTGQTYDARYVAGTGTDARMGYSYFYEWTANRIVTKMTALGIARNQYRISGPYSQNTTRGDVHADNVGSGHYLYQFNPYWGYADKAPLNAAREFLGHARDQGFEFDVFSIDTYTGQKAGVHPTADSFDRTRKIGDIIPYHRNNLEEYSFDRDMEIDLSELGVPVGTETECAAYWADTLSHCVLNRVRYPVMWGATNAALDADGGLVNRTTGAMLRTGEVFQFFKDHFGPDQFIFSLTDSEGLTSGIGSPTHLCLVNKTNQTVTTRVGQEDITLSAFETKLMDMVSASFPVRWKQQRRWKRMAWLRRISRK